MASGYDISLAANSNATSGLNNPFSNTDSSIASGAGRLTNGITGSQILMAIVVAAIALVLIFGQKKN